MTNLELREEQGNQCPPNLIDAVKAGEIVADITIAETQGNQATVALGDAFEEAGLMEPDALEWARMQGNQGASLLLKDAPTPPEPPIPVYDHLVFKGTGSVSPVSTMDTKPDLKYSFDGENFVDWPVSSMSAANNWIFDTLAVDNGTIHVRGTNARLSRYIQSKYTTFNCTGTFELLGTVQGLVTEDGTSTQAIEMARLFYAQTGITKVGNILQAETLVEACYNEMFYGCTNIVDFAAEFSLPATTLTNNCYTGMFYGCSGIEYLPANFRLPAVDLAGACYSGMFNGTGLLALPAGFTLLATDLPASCYANMFKDTPMVMSDNGTDFNFTLGVTYPVTTTGGNQKTFEEPLELANWMGNTNGFTLHQYMYFEVKSASSQIGATSGLSDKPDLQYSTDGVAFEDWPCTGSAGSWTFTPVVVSRDNKLYVRGTNERLSQYANNMYTTFSCTDGTQVEVHGSVQSLVHRTSQPTNGIEMARLFWRNKAITTGPLLPAVTVQEFGYYDMFHDCQSLVSMEPGFNLPASVCRRGCYYMMFEGCYSLVDLTTTFRLDSIYLADSCYFAMFAGCTVLTVLPAGFSLPATTLASSCYDSMFENTNITMSEDGDNFKFNVPLDYPFAASGLIFNIPRDVAKWMKNTRGFAEPALEFVPYPISYNMYGNNYAYLHDSKASHARDSGVCAFAITYPSQSADIQINIDGVAVSFSDLKIVTNTSAFRAQISGGDTQYAELIAWLEERDGCRIAMSNFVLKTGAATSVNYSYRVDTTTYAYSAEFVEYFHETQMTYYGANLYDKVKTTIECPANTMHVSFDWNLQGSNANLNNFAPQYSFNGIYWRAFNGSGANQRYIAINNTQTDRFTIYMCNSGYQPGWGDTAYWYFRARALNSSSSELTGKVSHSWVFKYLLVGMSTSMDSAATTANDQTSYNRFTNIFQYQKGLDEAILTVDHYQNSKNLNWLFKNVSWLTSWGGSASVPRLTWVIRGLPTSVSTYTNGDPGNNLFSTTTYSGTKMEITFCGLPYFNDNTKNYAYDGYGNNVYTKLHLPANCSLTTTPKTPYDKLSGC